MTPYFPLITDLLAIAFSIHISSLLVLGSQINIFAYHTGPTVFILLASVLSFYIFNLYDASRFRKSGETAIRLAAGVGLANILAGFISYVFGHWQFPQWLFILQAIISYPLLFGLRRVSAILAASGGRERVLIVGQGDSARELAGVMKHKGYQVVGYVVDSQDLWGVGPDGLFVAGPVSNVLSIAEAQQARTIVLAGNGTDLNAHMDVLLRARLSGIVVEELVTAYERVTDRVPVRFIQDRWLLLEQGFSLYSKDVVRKLKRTMDILVALLLLGLLWPLMGMAIILIKRDSPGPAIFSQARVGEGKRVFTLYKFRSMIHDAEQNGAVWAEQNDPRITKIGHWLRKTRIDELPQLINVIRGDMSLVGPRPERPEFVRDLEKEIPYYYIRHTVKPGITGWAQIMYPYGSTKKDALNKLEYELFYIKNMSLLLDVKILCRTIGVMVFGEGAR
jgi:sugar transferase (PEP-CTERM system associated)